MLQTAGFIRRLAWSVLPALLLSGCASIPVIGKWFESEPSATQPASAKPSSTNSPAKGSDSAGSSSANGAAADKSGTQQANARTQPSVVGSELNLRPDEPVVARALELTQKLVTSEEEKKTLAARVQQLELTVEEKEKAQVQATQEIKAATEEVARARSELQRWKQQVVALREKLGSAEKENLETLSSIVGVLEKMMDQDRRPEAVHETTEANDAEPPKASGPKRK